MISARRRSQNDDIDDGELVKKVKTSKKLKPCVQMLLSELIDYTKLSTNANGSN